MLIVVTKFTITSLLEEVILWGIVVVTQYWPRIRSENIFN